MDSKFYVSLEAARLLKEKGYPIEKDTPICNKYGDVIGCYPADRPTKAEAIDWLESKGIVVEFQYYQESSTWSYAIYCICYMSSDEEFPTRLEAEEAAIIKALELL
jgi:hypothetical protein